MGTFQTRGYVLNVPRALCLRYVGSIVEGNVKVNISFNARPPIMTRRQEVNLQGRFVNSMIQMEQIELNNAFVAENNVRLQNFRAPNCRRALD
ncbi:hypothetical protein M3Y95_00364700 [Aphelenchoides besseyi]|nr:hypothetical protein M3Y95_00364700 [Aphelenchoides besseyi]